MAAEGEFDRELIVHTRGYHRFLGMMRWGAVISFIIGLLVVFAISS